MLPILLRSLRRLISSLKLRIHYVSQCKNPIEGQRDFKLGIQKMIEKGLCGANLKRIGLIANQTSLLPNLTHVVDYFHESTDWNLVAIFAPEHGFRGELQAGDSFNHSVDPETQVPVYNIHRKQGQSLVDLFKLSDIDIVVFDLQDIGARFFTFIWTLYDCMEAVSMLNSSRGKAVEFVVCDRPATNGGLCADGPLLSKQFSSFLGRMPVALLHGMTVAELALLFNSEYILPKVPLTVMANEGWTRGTQYSELPLHWVPPSPNLPTFHSSLVYPGTCLFEGTNVSEGRGTTLPFQLIGAPWIDSQLKRELETLELPGVILRYCSFMPTTNKHAGVCVSGLQVHVAHEELVQPLKIGVALIVLLKRLYPDSFEWREDRAGVFFIDTLMGGQLFRQGVDKGLSADELQWLWQEDLVWFNVVRSRYLLYE